jgi:hypothetical protein
MLQQPPNKILGRSMRLTTKQREIFDCIFHSGGGYVLDFSDRTMAEWFEENCGLQIIQPRFQVEGSSKGKTLRGFVAVAEPCLVARVLRALWVAVGLATVVVTTRDIDDPGVFRPLAKLRMFISSPRRVAWTSPRLAASVSTMSATSDRMAMLASWLV